MMMKTQTDPLCSACGEEEETFSPLLWKMFCQNPGWNVFLDHTYWSSERYIKICVITLADSHPIVCENKKVTEVDFLVDVKTGTLYTDESGALCKIVCDDGDVYTVSSSIRGKLIEVNERLLSEPQLLADKPSSEGFLVMLLPRKLEHGSEMQRLMSAETYKQLLMERQQLADSGS